MHEASIALNILDIVIAQCKHQGFSQVEAIRLRIGKGSNILPEALTFAFDAAKSETIAADACLIIERVPLSADCRNCGSRVELEDRYSLTCPSCDHPSLHITTGFEMEIIDMEVN